MPRFQISCILIVTIVLMLMHGGCGTIKCGSTMCRNYDSTCDGGRILERRRKKMTIFDFFQNSFFSASIKLSGNQRTYLYSGGSGLSIDIHFVDL